MLKHNVSNYFILFSMKQRSELFSNFEWPDYLFYLQKLPDTPLPRNQLVVPKTNQEINEMVGVKIKLFVYILL
jgi:hypothetical protein